MKLTTIVKWSIPIAAAGVYVLYKIGKEEEQEKYLNTIRELYHEAILG